MTELFSGSSALINATLVLVLALVVIFVDPRRILKFFKLKKLKSIALKAQKKAKEEYLHFGPLLAQSEQRLYKFLSSANLTEAQVAYLKQHMINSKEIMANLEPYFDASNVEYDPQRASTEEQYNHLIQLFNKKHHKVYEAISEIARVEAAIKHGHYFWDEDN